MKSRISFVIVLVIWLILSPGCVTIHKQRMIEQPVGELKKEYYPSGKFKSEVNIVNNILEGIGRMYYESSQLEQETNFKNGMREGTAKRYRKNGRLWWEINFKNSKAEGFNKEF